ncbi:heavy metal-associated isoprenylated plant protein 39-like [Impatiens glandulifera]|uniref:heavy metal-associated isoprenylated plant protein 39-like n=1 Tax=Impatiens glandulifera TaxID=253017 RepID=UPI001FB094CB|nr:heavy metal-associated isoprenylated plant protein 39-like [Impatiens glandulifera]
MKKIVLKLELREGDEKGKQKVMTIASGLSGVESVTMDMKEKKLTITGDLDPVKVVGKLRKICPTDILTVAPAAKQDDQLDMNKNKNKHDGGGGAKKDDNNKQQQQPKDLLLLPQYYYYPPPPSNFNHQPYYYMNQNYRYPSSSEEDQEYSNSCVIS